jgi:integrase
MPSNVRRGDAIRRMDKHWGRFLKYARERGWSASEETEAHPVRRHDFRHTRITRWMNEGLPAQHVQAAAGHAKIEMTMGYTQLAEHAYLRGLSRARSLQISRKHLQLVSGE